MSPCRDCTALCCKYFALEIDTPCTMEEIENIRWYLAHERIAVFVDDKRWYLEIFNPCRFLSKDHTCKIYSKRPQLCREHTTHDCEFHDDPNEHELYFRSLEEFDTYLAKNRRK